MLKIDKVVELTTWSRARYALGTLSKLIGEFTHLYPKSALSWQLLLFVTPNTVST